MKKTPYLDFSLGYFTSVPCVGSWWAFSRPWNMKDPLSGMCAAALPLKGVGGRNASAVACDPALRHGDARPETGWTRRWVVGLCVMVAGQAVGQVPNDDCANADSLGLILTTTECLFGPPGFEDAGISIHDSTHLAGPNFPYPVHPGPCYGFSTTPWAPANDRWYRFHMYLELGHFLIIHVTAVDSLQIAFWQGGDCGTLTPLSGCRNMPAGTTQTLQVAKAYNVPNDPILMQVSSTSVLSHAHYQFCYRDFLDSSPIFYIEGTTPATPVMCMAHVAEVTNATGPTQADGAIDVQVTLGNAPFSIAWADGETAFSRSGLTPGAYPYILTDVNGCLQSDTAHVFFNVPQSVPLTGEHAACVVSWMPGGAGFSLHDQTSISAIRVLDNLGRLVVELPVRGGKTEFHSGHTAQQLWIALLVGSDGQTLGVMRFATTP